MKANQDQKVETVFHLDKNNSDGIKALAVKKSQT